MRIAYDGRSYHKSGTGDRTYFRELIGAMARMRPADKHTLYYREFDEDREAFAATAANISTLEVPHRVGWWWAQGGVSPRLKKDKIDLYHAQYLLPLTAPCPMVVTIHDITFRLFPEWLPPRMYRLMNILIPLAARVSQRVLTCSHNSKRDLVRHFRLPENKVVVTHLAVPHWYRPMAGDEAAARIREGYGLEGRYLVGVGLRGDRKNPGVVLRAIRQLKEAGRWPRDMQFALTGKPEHFPDHEVQELRDEIKFLGFVKDADLPALYSAATACFYPSKYEGFGLPPLEAMACGCPVLASNTSSMPEVLGEAGWLLSPEDTAGWSEALAQVVGDPVAREEMRQRGLIQAGKFSWEKTARETLAVYDELTAR